MSEPIAAGYVVKLVYGNRAVGPRWVMAGRGRGLVSRENATVFPDREAAMSEAKLWEGLAVKVMPRFLKDSDALSDASLASACIP
jgi:hypothetical protein